MAGIKHGGMGMGTGGVDNSSVGPGSSSGSGSGVFIAPPTRFQNNQQINIDWSAEEQCILEAGLAKYPYDSSIARYAKISVQLNNKTVRDVALRCRWMSLRENAKKLKEDLSPIRKMTDKKEKSAFSSSPQRAASNNNGNSAFFNATVQLLHHNSRVFDQVSANLSSNQVEDNIILLRYARDNLSNILSNLNEQQSFVARMPPLPVELNEELANSILAPSTCLGK